MLPNIKLNGIEYNYELQVWRINIFRPLTHSFLYVKSKLCEYQVKQVSANLTKNLSDYKWL